MRRIAEKRFVERKAKLDGRPIRYRLHDQAVRLLKGKLRLRQITRLTDDGKQTPMVTSRWDLRDIVVAYRMFERWRQENFFKYMRQEFLIDALSDYQVEPDDPERSVPNPARKAVDKELRKARAHLSKMKETYGAAFVDYFQGRTPTKRALYRRRERDLSRNPEGYRSHHRTRRPAEVASGASPAGSGTAESEARQAINGTKAPDQCPQVGCLPGRERLGEPHSSALCQGQR